MDARELAENLAELIAEELDPEPDAMVSISQALQDRGNLLREQTYHGHTDDAEALDAAADAFFEAAQSARIDHEERS